MHPALRVRVAFCGALTIRDPSNISLNCTFCLMVSRHNVIFSKEHKSAGHSNPCTSQISTLSSTILTRWSTMSRPSRSVDHAIARLRKKIEADRGHPRFIHTVHGDGYTITPEGRSAVSVQSPG